MKTLRTFPGQRVALGHQGENLALTVIFSIGAWVDSYGPGTVHLAHMRNGDPEAYPVAVTQEGTEVSWEVSDADTAVDGYGKYELRYIVGETVVKSSVGETYVRKALQYGAEPPEPVQSWLDHVAEKEHELLEAAVDAKEHSENASRSAGSAAISAGSAASSAKDAADYAAEAKKAADKSGGVKTVNGQAPDENGNVQIAVSGGSGVDVTAKPGQMIRVRSVDENGTPTTWEAVPWGYTESRMVEIVSETRTSSGSNEMFELYWMLSGVHAKLEVGKTYTIMYNGIPYECVCQSAPAGIVNDPNAVAMGNFSVVGGENTGEPFALIYENSIVSIVDLTGTTVNPVVGIYGEEEIPFPIPGKFLPEGVPYIEGGIVEILPECQPVFDSTIGAPNIGFITQPFDLVIGESYTVVFNGTEYKCVCQDAGALGPEYSGTPGLVNEGVNLETGEGLVFGIMSIDFGSDGLYGIIAFPSAPTEAVTLSIYQGDDIVHHPIPGELLPKGVPYVEHGAAVGKTIKISAVDENGVPTAWESVDFPSGGGNVDYVGVEPAEDDIPKIFFYGTAPTTKSEGDLPLTMEYYSKTKTIKNYVTLKVQGDSSASFPKKNFTVKMYSDEARETKDKHDFKNWGKQFKFVLKANWIDITHSRNVVSAKLWAQVVKSRSDYAELPELLRTSPNQGVIDGFFVKVYLNGVYQGRYTMNIPKDKWMANMDDDLDTHCILCSEVYNDQTAFKAEPVCNGSDWTDEIHDTMPVNLVQSWKNAANFIRTSTDEDFRANIGAYFNLNSLIDAYCYMVGCLLWDSDGKNQIFFTYDGVQWIQSMYDMDGAWGLHWQGSMLDVETYEVFDYGNILYLRMGELFYDEIQTRWTELRGSVMSSGNIINEFEQFMGICSPELVAEDYASTTADGKFTNIPSKTINNLQLLRANIVKRLAKADELIAALTPEVEVPCTGITLSESVLTFNESGTKTLTAVVTPVGCTDSVVWLSEDNAVATVNDGVVTAIANGNTKITAICGNFSASCSVNVSGIETGGGSEIPSEYTTLSYIEATGTQWIDTGISGGTSAAWEMELNTLGKASGKFEQILGGDQVSPILKLYRHYDYVNLAALQGANNANAFKDSDARHIVKVDNVGTIHIDGVEQTVKGKIGGWGTLTWYVFNSHSENIPANMRLYYLKMWKDGVLARDFVPSKRVNDNAIGLYDNVTGTFFANIGTGEFIAGDEV